MNMSKLISTFTLVTLLTTLGCGPRWRGAGEYGVGYRSETKVFVYQTVDGDKNDATAEWELVVNEGVLSAILKESTPTPPDPDPDSE